jgi:hypothetical protein
MKKLKCKNVWKLSVVLLAVIAVSSCDKSTENYTYVANVPIYQSYDEFRAAAITFEAAQPLENTGKIYFKGGKIYVNELSKGIHVIDNADPAAPNNIGFLSIPGNVDIAIKGNILYADSYVDLLAIDISDINNPRITKRIENVFEPSLPPFDETFPVAPLDHEKGVVVGWNIEKITEKVDVTGNYYYGGTRWGLMDVSAEVNSAAGKGGQTTYFVPNATGIAGSMARFIIYTDYLYTINSDDVNVYNISNTPEPSVGASFETSRVIETLFVYGDKLFIGSTTGMLIYNLANPANPAYLSMLDHFKSCDPVVVEGDYAYVTLRAGSGCGGTSNQLDVVDISNIMSPYLVKSYSLTGPYGLGIDDNVLFICDGDDGLKVFDATDKYAVDENMLAHFPDIHAYDIIPFSKVAMMIGDDGLYQYNYGDLNNLQLLSVIPIVK